MEEDNIKMVS